MFPVLMYHRIAPRPRNSTVRGHYVHPRAFERQLRMLRSLRYSVVDLRSFLEPDTWPVRPLAITFDDGYANFHTHALPALEKVGATATVFAVSNQVGGSNVWDSSQGDVHESLMSLDQLRDCIDRGMSIGSHTADHVDLAAASQEVARGQIVRSKAQLRELLHQEVEVFCYPYGRQTQEVQSMVKQAGYLLACSTEKGPNLPGSDPFMLKRINVRSDTTLPILLYKLLRGRSRGR
jgi:peptidoglycan/xylan/chitin deacetylase (PgdA/CDA1 family)